VRAFPQAGRHQGDQSYAVRRFTDEANRLYGVMNNRLHDRRTSRATTTRSPT
jgi:GST-like protein